MLKKIQRFSSSFKQVDLGRDGGCNGCADCCKLPNRCAFLKSTPDGEICSIYKVRPPSCRKFPRTQKQLDLVKQNCGFSFK